MTTSLSWKCVVGVAVAVLVAATARPALAQSNTADAVAAYDEAKRLMAEGKFAEACSKFAASYQADPQLGTLLNLADCHEKLGLIASAWAEYNEVAEIARKRGDNREEYARSRSDILAPRLSHLVIHSPADPIDGLVVRNNGVDVTSLLEEPMPVDPGTHAITAEAPGREPWNTSITIEGELDREEVAVPALAKAKEAPDPDDPSRIVEVPVQAESGNGRAGGVYRASFYASVVATAVGATVVVLSLRAQHDDEEDATVSIAAWQDETMMQLDLDDPCSDAATRLAGSNVDSRPLLETVDVHCRDGARHKLIANVSIAATAVAAIAAVFLYYKGFVGPRKRHARSVTVVPTMSTTSGGAELRISF